MQLQLSGLLPAPLAEMQHARDSFWQTGNITIEPGRYYEVVASSGKGKTTILDIVFGRRADYSGQYLIDGNYTAAFSLNKWAELRTHHFSYVFQGLRLFKHLTGYENIQIKNRLTNTLSDNDIEQFAKELGIESQLQKKAGLMSYGQQQRLAIIRAFAQPFDWLLLDEPFSHLDPEIAQVAAVLIVEICKNRGAGLIVTRLTQEGFIETYEQIVL